MDKKCISWEQVVGLISRQGRCYEIPLPELTLALYSPVWSSSVLLKNIKALVCS